VIAHGLENAMGLTSDELQAELNTHAFFRRMQSPTAGDLERAIFDSEVTEAELRFTMKSAVGEHVEVHVKSSPVYDESIDAAAVLIFSK
jgi:hypothetical protein